MAARKASAKACVKKSRSPRCKRCGKVIRIPDGWSAGPAVRKHYWAKHRDVMLPERSSR